MNIFLFLFGPADIWREAVQYNVDGAGHVRHPLGRQLGYVWPGPVGLPLFVQACGREAVDVRPAPPSEARSCSVRTLPGHKPPDAAEEVAASLLMSLIGSCLRSDKFVARQRQRWRVRCSEVFSVDFNVNSL